MKSFGQVIDNTVPFLEKNRYCAVVIGDKYANSEIVPLGFHCMNLFIQKGLKLKAILVKNFEETKGKANQKAIWRYRALASDFFIFKHEYIFVFKNAQKEVNKLKAFTNLKSGERFFQHFKLKLLIIFRHRSRYPSFLLRLLFRGRQERL